MLNHSLALDRTFHALAASKRRSILERLGRGPLAVKELCLPLDISLAATLQHLGVLEKSGLVSSDKSGRVRTCRLTPEGLSMAERWFQDRKQEWERHFNRLGDFLAQQERALATTKKYRKPTTTRKARR